jgi:hypothetical protein
MNDDARKSEALDHIRAALLDAGFDAATVIASWQTEHGETKCVFRGTGNWYARQGMLRHMLAISDENARLEERRSSDLQE